MRRFTIPYIVQAQMNHSKSGISTLRSLLGNGTFAAAALLALLGSTHALADDSDRGFYGSITIGTATNITDNPLASGGNRTIALPGLGYEFNKYTSLLLSMDLGSINNDTVKTNNGYAYKTSQSVGNYNLMAFGRLPISASTNLALGLGIQRFETCYEQTGADVPAKGYCDSGTVPKYQLGFEFALDRTNIIAISFFRTGSYKSDVYDAYQQGFLLSSLIRF